MTVGELRKLLAKYPNDMVVGYVDLPMGDRIFSVHPMDADANRVLVAYRTIQNHETEKENT